MVKRCDMSPEQRSMIGGVPRSQNCMFLIPKNVWMYALPARRCVARHGPPPAPWPPCRCGLTGGKVRTQSGVSTSFAHTPVVSASICACSFDAR